jgi:hypothetical protein
MTAFIMPDDGSARIIPFDAILDELHETVSEITEHPVEVGVDVTDHVRPLPDRLNLVGVISNQPIVVNPFTERGELIRFQLEVPKYEPPLEPTPGSIFRNTIAAVDGLLFGEPEYSAQLLAFPDEFDAIRETYEALVELQKNAVLLEVLTPLRWYEDMILERVGAPRTAGNGSVAFAMDLRQLRVVESGQVASPPVSQDPSGSPLAQKGSQGAKPPGAGEDEEQPASIAYNILSGQGLI